MLEGLGVPLSPVHRQYRAGMDENAVDVNGLAKLLSISVWKARELGNDPSFPSFRMGRAHRFWPSEVREHLQREREMRDPWKQSRQSLGRKRIMPNKPGYYRRQGG
jgi:hypothetical protein